MKIKNLSQLKKAINNKNEFIIVEHGIRPEYVGQIRKPNLIQTNGFYSIVDNEPNHPVTLANSGKGSWIEYGKASDWKFENELCIQYIGDRKIWTIEFLDW
ncbi:peptidylprolyl isomerase [Mediterraneibacter sp. NSJ-55]|uniref:Peptidylprolyl isomerase n=1 Tax=Mediterraneibacter hominis TaxID=2763054 RepID=A0A923RP75_9FIRM|nr:peptidylprolyl isomerase [Mediterraneibacter hominis]MBC5688170.1 peptidylprolyl isomerase [Mediterraneibacter hominis]